MQRRWTWIKNEKLFLTYLSCWENPKTSKLSLLFYKLHNFVKNSMIYFIYPKNKKSISTQNNIPKSTHQHTRNKKPCMFDIYKIWIWKLLREDIFMVKDQCLAKDFIYYLFLKKRRFHRSPIWDMHEDDWQVDNVKYSTDHRAKLWSKGHNLFCC